MNLTTVTPSAALPVSLADVKLQLRLDTDTDVEDSLLTRLVRASAERCSHETGRAMLTTAYRLEAGIAEKLLLPRPPLVEVTAVTLIDSAGNETVLTESDYTLNQTRAQTLLTVTDPGDAVTVVVEFDAGYGETAASLPEALASWILLDVATLYEQRQALTAGNLNAVPYPFVGGLLDSYRVSY